MTNQINEKAITKLLYQYHIERLYGINGQNSPITDHFYWSNFYSGKFYKEVYDKFIKTYQDQLPLRLVA